MLTNKIFKTSFLCLLLNVLLLSDTTHAMPGSGDYFSEPLTYSEHTGLVTALSSDFITVDNRTFELNAATRIESIFNLPFNYILEVGVLVKIEFITSESVDIARKVEVENTILGTSIDDLEITGTISAISDDAVTIRGVTAILGEGATNLVTLEDNLNSASAKLSAGVDPSFDYTTFSEFESFKQYSVSFDVYDSVNIPHNLTAYFFHLQTNPGAGGTWQVVVIADGSEIFGDGVGEPSILGSTEFDFSMSGERLGAIPDFDILASIQWSNGLESEIDFSFASLVQFASASSVQAGSQERNNSVYQDARGNLLTLDDFTVGQNAKLVAVRHSDGDYYASNLSLLEPKNIVSFDGRGESEKVVFRQTTGTWYIRYRENSIEATDDFEQLQWGLPGDIPLSGDYDGDGRNDFVVWRPSNGTWYLRLSSSGFNVHRTVQWGLPGDKPFAADIDGDSVDDFIVWRPNSGTWFAFLSRGGDRDEALAGNPEHVLVRQWGLSHFEALVGDRDGDGRADLIVVDAAHGLWYTLYSSSGYDRDAALSGDIVAGDAIQFGSMQYDYLLGDFDGDGRDDLCLFHRGQWIIRFSSFNGFAQVSFGSAGDIPGVTTVPSSGEDKRDRLQVYRPSNGNHYERSPSGDVTVIQWGLPNIDTPVGNYVR